jgi:Fic family protein
MNLQNIKPNKDKALMLLKREISSFVTDAVNLEGINITLPEVQTLLQGITVGGHKLSDQQIVINQHHAWETLMQWIKSHSFEVTAQKACALHAIAGKDEALEWGQFRSGGVTIAGTQYLPPKSSELNRMFDTMIEEFEQVSDIYDKAIFIFLCMARCQFFYDVNKRMGRFMMNGVLLNAGYPAINLPAKRRLEFNQLMLSFYHSNDQKPMNIFMRSCLDDRAVEIMQE